MPLGKSHINKFAHMFVIKHSFKMEKDGNLSRFFKAWSGKLSARRTRLLLVKFDKHPVLITLLS